MLDLVRAEKEKKIIFHLILPVIGITLTKHDVFACYPIDHRQGPAHSISRNLGILMRSGCPPPYLKFRGFGLSGRSSDDVIPKLENRLVFPNNENRTRLNEHPHVANCWPNFCMGFPALNELRRGLQVGNIIRDRNVHKLDA